MIATYEPELHGPLVAGVDVGGTKTSVVVTDDRDCILYEHVEPTDRSSLIGQIARLVNDARHQLRQDIAAVGVAIPGHVDPADGSVSMAVNLGITHLRLGPMLQTELGVPTFVEHDARAAALWLSGQTADASAQAPASVAFLAIGTGISAGVVLQGALLRGDNGEYVSHSTWESRDAFNAWTQSEAFIKGHRQGGSLMGVLQGPPAVKVYDAVIEQEFAPARA